MEDIWREESAIKNQKEIDDIISFARLIGKKEIKLAQDKKAIVAILEQGRDVVKESRK